MTTGLTVAVVLGAIVWWIARPKPVPVAITSVPVEVRTDPQGASVRIGDRSCVTPNCRLVIPPGNYTVQAQLQGYEPLQQALDVNAAHPASVTLMLRPVPPPPPTSASGTLTVKSLPDALVVVDNLPRGRTDARGILSLPLEAATHNVRVEKTGYDTAGEQRVKIGKLASEAVAFKLTPQMATLQLRGAPAGVEVRAGGRIGRTDGTPFSALIPPGDQVIRLAEGSATRDISQRFEPGQVVSLEWGSVAPPQVASPPPSVPPAPPSPPKPDPAELAWLDVSAGQNPEAVQNYLDKYPNSPHAPEARSRLELLTWSSVNQNDVQSLREYLSRFPAGPHVSDASRRVAELTWNSVNQKDEQALRSFMAQNPDSPYRAQAQTIVDQIVKQRLDAQARLKQEQEQAKQVEAERAQVLMVFDRFNAALAQKKKGELQAVWPNATRSYIDALKTAVLLRLEDPQVVNITRDHATVTANVTTEKTVPPRPPQPVKLTLEKQGGQWIIVSMTGNR